MIEPGTVARWLQYEISEWVIDAETGNRRQGFVNEPWKLPQTGLCAFDIGGKPLKRGIGNTERPQSIPRAK